MIDITKIKTLLLNTGLQQKDNPTYQVFLYLIDGLNDTAKLAKTTTSVTGAVGPQGPPGPPGFSLGDSDGDGETIPGPQGVTGATGPQGVAGVIGPPGESSEGDGDFIVAYSPSQFAMNDMTPTFIGINDTFVVPLYKQAFYEIAIDSEGTLEVDGFLIAV